MGNEFLETYFASLLFLKSDFLEFGGVETGPNLKWMLQREELKKIVDTKIHFCV